MVGEAEQRARFGYALQQALLERDMSERELAKRLGIDPRKVARWRAGKQFPSYPEAVAIMRELRVSERIFNDPPPIPERPAYPIAEYLLEEAARSGTREGLRRAREGQGSEDLGPRTPLPARPVPGASAVRRPRRAHR